MGPYAVGTGIKLPVRINNYKKETRSGYVGIDVGAGCVKRAFLHGRKLP